MRAPTKPASSRVRRVSSDLNFFSYTDFDLNNTGGDDRGVFIAPNQMQISDASAYQAGIIASSTGLVRSELLLVHGLRFEQHRWRRPRSLHRAQSDADLGCERLPSRHHREFDGSRPI